MTTTALDDDRLSARDLAILAAVDAGRVEITVSCEPDLFVDGMCCCDQLAGRALARAGFIARRGPGALGRRCVATLTAAGAAALSAAQGSRAA